MTTTGVFFFGILYQDTRQNADRFIDEMGGQAYPTLIDPGSRTAITYGLYGVPETYVIDRDGIVVHKQVGPVTERGVAGHIEAALRSTVCNEAELNVALARARPLRHRVALNSVHLQGSCRLGATRDRSAVDPYGEVWGEKSVFVCDASLFPTSVGVPPQVTTMALAAAVADYVIAERL